MAIIYGSNVANGTLATACTMSATTGGVEASVVSTTSAPGTYAEVLSQTGSETGVASIPAPTGHGWVYLPGAGTFATGNWSAICNVSFAFIDPGGSNLTIRFYKYSSGVYTSIGSIVVAVTTTAKTAYSFTATSMSTVTFGTTDLLYVDLWMHDGGADVGGDAPAVYVSNSATAGVANDMQITTSTFTPAGSPSRTITATAALSLAGVTQNNVSTSTVVYATRQQIGQRTFIASDGTACVLWVDGTNQVFSYASSPYSSWTKVTLRTGVQTALAGMWRAGTDNIDTASGGTASMAGNYVLLTKSGVTWTLGTSNVFSGATTLGTAGVGNVMSYAGQDAQGRHWVVCGGASTYTNARAWFSPANTPTSTGWTNSSNITQTADVNSPAGDQCGNFMLRIYWNGTALQYVRVDDSVVSLGAWSTATTIPNLAGSPNASSSISFRGISTTKGMLVYSTTTGIRAQTYDPVGNTWSAATQLSTNGSDRHPTIATDELGNAWVAWASFNATNDYSLVYSAYNGTSWDSSPTAIVGGGTNIDYPNAGFGHNTVGILYTVGTATPWTVGLVTITTGATSSRTITPNTAALQLTSLRTVTSTAALQALGTTRTITATVALSTPGLSRTISSTAALQAIGLTRTITSMAALLQTSLRTITSTVALSLSSQTRTITPDTVALELTSIRTITATAALQALGTTRTIASTAALQAILTRSIMADSALLATSMRTITCDCSVDGLNTFERTITSDSALLATFLRTITSDVALQALGETRTITCTASLSALGTFSRTITTTAALGTPGLTRTITSDVSLRATLMRTITATAALEPTPRTIPITAALELTSLRTITCTASLNTTGTLTRTITADSALRATSTRTITATVAVQTTGLTRTIGTNTGALLATFQRTITSSGALILTSQRMISCTVALAQLNNSRTIMATSALQATSARTIVATASIEPVRAIPASVALKGTSTRSIPCTASIVAGVILTNATITVRSGTATVYVRSGVATITVRS